jgi:hypothetical protein
MWEDTTGAQASTRKLAGLLAEEGHPARAGRVGHDVAHDWPWWRRQLTHTCTGCAALRKTRGGPVNRHLVGLLLGTEEDWPAAFENAHAAARAGPLRLGDEHAFDVERITIEPFDLRDKPRYDLVIDRLAYWYYHPREWLKKVALMDDVYLLNSPFTFQSMEKHAAYCAMMRLGLKVPETVLVPYKNPPDNAKCAYTARRYNQPFDLDAIAERMGYRCS